MERAYDLENILIEKDFSSWREELSIAAVEMEFCQNLFIATLNDVDITHKSKYTNIIEKLSLLRKKNDEIKNEFVALTIQFEGYAECQDMQCDNYYKIEYLVFRERIEKHFSVYGNLKKNLLSKVKKENRGN